MITKRDRNTRGTVKINWLQSKHSFSFGHYYDSNHMGFGSLRVINQDRVQAGAGFPTHPHKNMEIISYVLEGTLTHEDSKGNSSSIKSGDIQIMSAGSGIAHSEFNGSNREDVHFLQIWIEPNVKNERPNYQQKSFPAQETKNNFRVVISHDGENDSLIIKQDARMLIGTFESNQTNQFQAKKSRKYWLQMARGLAKINGEKAFEGDGFAIEGEDTITIHTIEETEILLFDLP